MRNNLSHKMALPLELRLVWKPPDLISIPDWVEKHVKLTGKSCDEPGPLRISRTPYTRGPLLALGSDFVEWIVLCFGRQTGKTEGIQVPFMCYVIAQDPGPTTFFLPIQDKCKEVEAQKIGPILAACEAVQRQRTADKDDYSILRKVFKNMVLSMAWGGSAAQTTTRSTRYLLRDETDEQKKSIGGDAIDPMKGIEQTTSNFSNRKIVDSSSPTTTEGYIWTALGQCDGLFEYWLPCPHCGVQQILYWENVRFGENKDPIIVEEIAFYECEICHESMTNLDKIRMLSRGEWRARTTADPTVQIMKNVRARIEETISLDEVLADRRMKKLGFHLPKWYSPFPGGTFGIIGREFLEAHKAMDEGLDFAPMKNWRIYCAARPWEEVVVSETEYELMKNKTDLGPLVCPKATIALTCGIDPGQGGFWFSVVAWKRDMSSHLVHYGWFAGDYESSEIDNLLQWTYAIDREERQLQIWRIGIDTGGGEYQGANATMTVAAYNWIRKVRRPGLVGTKGMSHPSTRRVRETRIEKMPGDKGAVIPRGIILMEINTDVMKDVVWFHLRIDESKPGRFTFHNATEPEYIHHLLAEAKQMEKNGKWTWIRKRAANHLFDATVIAFALADPECHGGIKVLDGGGPFKRRMLSRGVE